MNHDFEKLLARLRAATKPNYELSYALLRACGWLGYNDGKTKGGILIPHWEDPKGKKWPTPPHPTKSIDDALLLIPEGFKSQCLTFPKATNYFYFEIFPPTGHKAWLQGSIFDRGATAPLAICICALRARILDQA